MEDRLKYLLYLVIVLPLVFVNWWMGFPRGYYMAFFGIGLGVTILVYFRDDLVTYRAVWKEYFIGLTGVMLIPIIAIFNGDSIYISAIDLYYYLIGITVFEIGIVPFYWIDAKYGDRGKEFLILSVLVSVIAMLIISYILFVSMNITVVH